MKNERPIEKLKRLFAGAPNPSTLSIDQIRRGTEQLTKVNPAASDIRTRKHEISGVPVVWVDVKGSCFNKVVLYTHGGAFVAGSPNSHLSIMGELARAAKARVLAIDYRLAPEHPFPSGLDDCMAVYETVSANLDFEHLAVAGDSAGGGLALSTLMRARENGWRNIDAAVFFSPWLDLSCSSSCYEELRHEDPLLNRELLMLMAEHYLNGVDPGDSKVSPLFGDFSGLPPTLIQVGECEVLRGDSILFKKHLKSAGIEVEIEVWSEMFHVWQGYTTILPEALQALQRAGEYLNSVWGR